MCSREVGLQECTLNIGIWQHLIEEMEAPKGELFPLIETKANGFHAFTQGNEVDCLRILLPVKSCLLWSYEVIAHRLLHSTVALQ